MEFSTPGRHGAWAFQYSESTMTFMGWGAPGLAGALRHNSFIAHSAFDEPNLSQSSLRNRPARMVSIASLSLIDTPSLSATNCNASVASGPGIKLSGLPNKTVCQNALGCGIGGGTGSASGAVCDDPGALREACGSAAGADSALWHMSELTTATVCPSCDALGGCAFRSRPNPSGNSCSSARASSRQEFKLERDGATTNGPPCPAARAARANSSTVSGLLCGTFCAFVACSCVFAGVSRDFIRLRKSFLKIDIKRPRYRRG